jgi:hypothetical protein
MLIVDLLGARLVLSAGRIGMITCEDLERKSFSGLYVEDFLGDLTSGDGGRIMEMMAALLHLQ